MLKNRFGFNFWPSFTDLMLSFVLIVLIILFVVSKMIAAGTENLDRARRSQQSIETQIEQGIGKQYKVVTLSDRDGANINKEMANRQADVYIIDKLDHIAYYSKYSESDTTCDLGDCPDPGDDDVDVTDVL